MTAEYITKPGDRWDLIAYRAYGTIGEITLADGQKVNAMSYIIENNSDITRDSILEEGLLLQIPIVPTLTVQSNKNNLPPWKQ